MKTMLSEASKQMRANAERLYEKETVDDDEISEIFTEAEKTAKKI